jgi:hypothetical protein
MPTISHIVDLITNTLSTPNFPTRTSLSPSLWRSDASGAVHCRVGGTASHVGQSRAGGGAAARQRRGGLAVVAQAVLIGG